MLILGVVFDHHKGAIIYYIIKLGGGGGSRPLVPNSKSVVHFLEVDLSEGSSCCFYDRVKRVRAGSNGVKRVQTMSNGVKQG